MTIASVGVYAPGGKARYPSSVLMSAVPARVAGVKDIILATPAPDDLLVAAAHLAGVTGILDALPPLPNGDVPASAPPPPHAAVMATAAIVVKIFSNLFMRRSLAFMGAVVALSAPLFGR